MCGWNKHKAVEFKRLVSEKMRERFDVGGGVTVSDWPKACRSPEKLMGDMEADGHVAIVGVRQPKEDGQGHRHEYGMVVGVEWDSQDAGTWTLHYLPLRHLYGKDVQSAGDMFPQNWRESLYEAWEDAPGGELKPENESAVKSVSLSESTLQDHIGAPLPEPGVILAAAANFWSHLKHDLALDPPEAQKTRIEHARARAFLKYGHDKRLAINDGKGYPTNRFKGYIGPYDTMEYPARLTFDRYDGGGETTADTVLDYEAEVGVVIAERIDWEAIKESDEQQLREYIWSRIGGYVLVNDSKVRTPQAYRGIAYRLDRGETGEASDKNSFSFDDRKITVAFGGEWRKGMCEAWSLAAAEGDYAAVGPYFLVRNPQAPPRLTPRDLALARSYGNKSDALVVRQAINVREDALVWSVPKIVTSILDPRDNFLWKAESPDDRQRHNASLLPGDIIALGTPGGCVITGKPEIRWLKWPTRLLATTGFLYSRMVKKRFKEEWLRKKHRVFLWGEWLGSQVHDIESR